VTDRQNTYASGVVERLRAAGFRAELDARNEKLGYKIREAQLQKVPYMLVVGDKEAANGTVAPRRRHGGAGDPMTVEELLTELQAESAGRTPATNCDEKEAIHA
jgi:threonyl-tRNA synthetase